MSYNSFSVLIVFLIMVAGMTKRAQIPFSSWLPAAMAAPTPVRALVHSSTLVTAGVFLLIRFYPYLSKVRGFNMTILIIACMTIFMAGVRALVECDIKKIVALSTLRQLGVIMAAIGLGLPILAYFHLVTHALFKALLFVCVGRLIHLHHHRQDLRVMGNLRSQIPLTLSCLNIANLALCGLPFMAGFYSKDLIIEMSLYNCNRYVVVLLFVLATMITAAYSVRLTFTGLVSIRIGYGIQYVDDSTVDNTTPMIMLSLGAIVGGAFLNWLILAPIREPVLRYSSKLLAFVVTIVGAAIIYFSVKINGSLAINMKLAHNRRAYIWFMVPMRTQIMLGTSFLIGKNNLKVIDQG